MPSQCCPRRKALLWCLAAAALLLAVCSKSSPLYPLNDWMDANIFYTMGKAMMNGSVLYRDVFDHKGPLLYLIYGLGWCVDHTGFFGVFLFEIAAFAAFLYWSLRTAELFAGPLHPAWALAAGAPVAAGQAFAHGGSAEELCLPFLAWALYEVLHFALQTPADRRPVSLGRVAALGFGAGCVLWVKFTMMGFFLGWVLVLAVFYLRAGWLRQLGRSCAAYLGGMVLSTLPWLVYFGVNGALGDFFGTYFGDNLFLYSGGSQGDTGLAATLLAIVQKTYWGCHDTPLFAVLAALGILWMLLRRHFACVVSVAVLAVGLAVTGFARGAYHVYYFLPFGVFAALGIAPLALAARKLPVAVKTFRNLLPAAGAAAALAFCLLTCHNAGQLLRPAEELPQYQFASIMEQNGGGTLLNYGTLDGGFYTVTGVQPPCRFFCVTNLPMPEQQEQQNALMGSGGVDFAVSLDPSLGEHFDYTLTAQAEYDGGEGNITWYLYRKNS